MAGKAKDDEPKRLNRAVGVGDALKGVLDAALKKRGFATRDILSNWAAMAPKPYDVLAFPHELKWPRGAGHEGATLYLRCAAGHRLALSHEAPRVAAAVNRYFGYVLVREVRLSAEPLGPPKAEPASVPELAAASAEVAQAVASVEHAGLRAALKDLGSGVSRRRKARK